jgi:hypothetical protein
MAFKPNYNQQRAERDRAKQAKRDEKLRQRQEQVAQRRGKDAADDTPDDISPDEQTS